MDNLREWIGGPSAATNHREATIHCTGLTGRSFGLSGSVIAERLGKADVYEEAHWICWCLELGKKLGVVHSEFRW